MFFLLLRELRFGTQALLVIKVLLNLFIGNLYSIKDITLMFNLFSWFIYLFMDNTQLIFYV